MPEHMINIRLYWQDLSKEMQDRLLKLFGDNCNWDCVPMTIIEIENNDNCSNYPNRDIEIDSFLGGTEL